MKKGTAAVLSALLLSSVVTPCSGKAYLQGDRIVVVGSDNTLATVARDIADTEIFLFDPEHNVATANRNLTIRGTFRVGTEAEEGDSTSPFHVLEMNVSRCGAVNIEVAAGEGELRLHRAKVVTVHETDDECSDPNVLVVWGKLVAGESEISGNIECLVKPRSSIQILDSTFAYTQDSALSCDLQEGQQLEIRNSAFIDNAAYGIRIGRCPDSFEISDSVFRGAVADVFHGGGGEVALTDCDLKTVKFGTLSGKVARKWSVVIEAPRPGLQIVARSAKGNPQRETVRGVSGEDGTCSLSLTEYVAFPPRAQQFKEGVNNATPHEILVYENDGKTLLYRMENFHVFMKGQKARFQ
jgi:hypothetical protein